MKLLSIAIPCYNSQGYMAKCIESLLPGGEDVEILVVNDGSKDDTAKIADEYAAKYPTIVRAIHKENGGHGSAVNAGLENAQGVYFKVVERRLGEGGRVSGDLKYAAGADRGRAGAGHADQQFRLRERGRAPQKGDAL